MAQTNIDTLHTAGSVSSLSGDALEVYIDNQIDDVEGYIDSEIDKVEHLVAPVMTLLNITGYTELSTTGLSYIRCSGGTYQVVLPAATGSLNELHIKKINAGVITLIPNGVDTIDFITTKDIIEGASIYLIDGVLGNWDIN